MYLSIHLPDSPSQWNLNVVWYFIHMKLRFIISSLHALWIFIICHLLRCTIRWMIIPYKVYLYHDPRFHDRFFSVPEGAVLGKTDMWSAGVVIYVILASQLLEDSPRMIWSSERWFSVFFPENPTIFPQWFQVLMMVVHKWYGTTGSQFH